jgi:hypothetical protein
MLPPLKLGFPAQYTLSHLTSKEAIGWSCNRLFLWQIKLTWSQESSPFLKDGHNKASIRASSYGKYGLLSDASDWSANDASVQRRDRGAICQALAGVEEQSEWWFGKIENG